MSYSVGDVKHPRLSLAVRLLANPGAGRIVPLPFSLTSPLMGGLGYWRLMRSLITCGFGALLAP